MWEESKKPRRTYEEPQPSSAKQGTRGKDGKEAKEGKEGKQGRRPSTEEQQMLISYRLRNKFDPERLANFAELERALGTTRGAPMFFRDADNGTANALNDRYNRAAAVVAHELRLYGFNVTAARFVDVPGSISKQLSDDTRLAWRKRNGGSVEYDGIFCSADKDFRNKFERSLATVGARFHIGWDPMDGSDGHILTALRTKDGLFIYDPQKNRYYTFDGLLRAMGACVRVEVLRVGRLLFNSAFVGLLLLPV